MSPRDCRVVDVGSSSGATWFHAWALVGGMLAMIVPGEARAEAVAEATAISKARQASPIMSNQVSTQGAKSPETARTLDQLRVLRNVEAGVCVPPSEQRKLSNRRRPGTVRVDPRLSWQAAETLAKRKTREGRHAEASALLRGAAADRRADLEAIAGHDGIDGGRSRVTRDLERIRGEELASNSLEMRSRATAQSQRQTGDSKKRERQSMPEKK